MSDAIREALEKAAEACQGASHMCFAGNLAELNKCLTTKSWQPCRCRRQAAAAVAAFLRALPACDVMMERNSWEGGPHSTHTLAAAVERAAREGSS